MLFSTMANGAVVSRNQRPSKAASIMPTLTTNIQNANSSTETATPETETAPVSVESENDDTAEEEIIISPQIIQMNTDSN